MSDNTANNKRIVKNTLALYFRTFITMIVGLYTGRVMLHALGVDNYGINNVVGGIVGFSTLITATMSEAISRYITYILGKGDINILKSMFSTAINAQIIMSLIVVAFLEIFGLWFLNYQAQIPDGRMVAAHWVFQCSLISLVIGLISSPYNALLIAHEHLSIYAYTSIVDAILKLAICFLIMAFAGDRLILFAILTVWVGLGMRVFYGWYCSKHFEEAYYNPNIFNKDLLKEITVFSGWNLLNNGAYVFATQGVNMLINVFFGVAYNAARGIAITVNGAIQAFVGNFTMAFSPQITKKVASGEHEYAISMCNRGTKISWLMLYIFIVPVCCEAETLLSLWLGDVPSCSVLFLRFAMFESLSVISGQNLYRLILADGHVKNYTIQASVVAGLVFPVSWILYNIGSPVWAAYLVFILCFCLLNIIRLINIKVLMPFSIKQFVREAMIPCFYVSVASFIIPLFICQYMEPCIFRFLINVPIAVLWTGICSILLGLTKSERLFFWNKAQTLFAKIRK